MCHSRGLDTTDVDPEALVQWLADWVELSDAAGGEKSTNKHSCHHFHGNIWQYRNLIGNFRVAFCLCFKTSPGAKPSYENEFDLHENEHVSKTHFHVKGFAPGLVLKQRSKGTRKWPICYQMKNQMFYYLTPSLPESNLESINVVVTFESVDETLVRDHSNESY